MTTRTLRRFNRKGREAFEQCLRGMKAGRPENHLPLLEDDALTAPVDEDCAFEVREFQDRGDAAEYLDTVIGQLGMTEYQLRHDVGLWTWLGAAWLDLLIPEDNGTRMILHRGRLVPLPESKRDPVPRLVLNSADFQRYYRHWLAGPWSIYRLHRQQPDRAKVLLCTPVTAPGEVAEQFGANPTIVSRASTVEAITKLYMDPGTGKLKVGVAGNGNGSARRMVKVLKQLDLTYDREEMDADAIISLLPDEFDRFRGP